MRDRQDLKANQHIISLSKSSKALSEDALESLPGLIAVIDPTGRVPKEIGPRRKSMAVPLLDNLRKLQSELSRN